MLDIQEYQNDLLKCIHTFENLSFSLKLEPLDNGKQHSVKTIYARSRREVLNVLLSECRRFSDNDLIYADN